jgi:hypothetical protein
MTMETPKPLRAVSAQLKGPHHVGTPCRNLRLDPQRVVSVAVGLRVAGVGSLLPGRDTLAPVGKSDRGVFLEPA